MVLAVEHLGVSPAPAAILGAALGAMVNFALGRGWVFRDQSGPWTSQAPRYALVAAASAIMNGFGEHVVHDVARVPYVEARVLVSLAVGLLWNFPMQRTFVFPRGRP